MKKTKKFTAFFLALVMILSSIPATSITVSSNSIHSPILTEHFNGHTYAIFDVGMTWREAKTFSESLGGHLATITSQEEQSFIEKIMAKGTKYHYWLGGECEENWGEWRWITGEEWNYTNWRVGEPNNAHGQGEYWLQILRLGDFGKWNDLHSTGALLGFEEDDALLDFYSLANTGFIVEWSSAFSPDDTPDTIKVFLNGERITFDQQPFIENGRTLVPMRAIAETMGGAVEWDDERRMAIITFSELQIRLVENRQEASILTRGNTHLVSLDVPMRVINGRSFVPLRFVAEAFNVVTPYRVRVDWHDATKTADITTVPDGSIIILPEGGLVYDPQNLFNYQLYFPIDMAKSLYARTEAEYMLKFTMGSSFESILAYYLNYFDLSPLGIAFSALSAVNFINDTISLNQFIEAINNCNDGGFVVVSVLTHFNLSGGTTTVTYTYHTHNSNFIPRTDVMNRKFTSADNLSNEDINNLLNGRAALTDLFNFSN